MAVPQQSHGAASALPWHCYGDTHHAYMNLSGVHHQTAPMRHDTSRLYNSFWHAPPGNAYAT